MPTTRTALTSLVVLLAGGGLFAQATGQTAPPKPPTTAPVPQSPSPPVAPASKPTLAFPDGVPVAYVEIQGVVAASKFGQCGTNVLNALRQKHASALAPMQKDLNDANARLQTQQGVMSQSALVQLTRLRDRLQLELQSMAAQFQTDETNANQDLVNDFQAKALPLVEAIRKDKNLTFILSRDTSGAILAANPALDLTGELVKRLDAAYPNCTPKGGE